MSEADEHQQVTAINTSQLYSEFPYLESFPFNNFYRIALTKDITSNAIGPYLMDIAYATDETESITFSYKEEPHEIYIYFLKEDIIFFQAKATYIKTLNSVREALDDGLTSMDMSVKAKCVNLSISFLNKVDPGYADFGNFNGILNDLIEISNANFYTLIAEKAKAFLEGRTVKLTTKERDVLTSYFNFQLHHAKIILGMIIAAKIH